MGADGGVAWLDAHDVEAVAKLLSPWWDSLVSFDAGSSYGDHSRYEWVTKNPHGNICGGYGTDHSDISWDRLNSGLLRYLDRALQCEQRGIGKDATFQDLWDEIETRPTRADATYGEGTFSIWAPSHLNDWLTWLEPYMWTYPGQPEERAGFMAQKIGPWLKEVRLALTGYEDHDPDVRTEETWT